MKKSKYAVLIIGIMFLMSIYSTSSVSAQVSSKKPVKSSSQNKSKSESMSKSTTTTSTQTTSQSKSKQKALPRLVDLGAKKCIPCKMMAPLLEELSKEYKDKLKVEFIDVWENPSAGTDYKIHAIPTQIFYDSDGKEFFRHVGYYPKEDILAKFKENKIDLTK